MQMCYQFSGSLSLQNSPEVGYQTIITSRWYSRPKLHMDFAPGHLRSRDTKGVIVNLRSQSVPQKMELLFCILLYLLLNILIKASR